MLYLIQCSIYSFKLNKKTFVYHILIQCAILEGVNNLTLNYMFCRVYRDATSERIQHLKEYKL